MNMNMFDAGHQLLFPKHATCELWTGCQIISYPWKNYPHTFKLSVAEALLFDNFMSNCQPQVVGQSWLNPFFGRAELHPMMRIFCVSRTSKVESLMANSVCILRGIDTYGFPRGSKKTCSNRNVNLTRHVLRQIHDEAFGNNKNFTINCLISRNSTPWIWHAHDYIFWSAADTPRKPGEWWILLTLHVIFMIILQQWDGNMWKNKFSRKHPVSWKPLSGTFTCKRWIMQSYIWNRHNLHCCMGKTCIALSDAHILRRLQHQYGWPELACDSKTLWQWNPALHGGRLPPSRRVQKPSTLFATQRPVVCIHGELNFLVCWSLCCRVRKSDGHKTV